MKADAAASPRDRSLDPKWAVAANRVSPHCGRSANGGRSTGTGCCRPEVFANLVRQFGARAGLSIRRDRIAEFRRRLNEHAASCLTEDDLTPALYIDAEVGTDALGFQLCQDLRALEPFGAGNPRPVFMTRGFRVLSEPQIIKEQHLKLRVTGEDNRPMEAIWWRGVEAVDAIPQTNQRVDLAYEFEANRWQGDIRLQLNVRDMRNSV